MNKPCVSTSLLTLIAVVLLGLAACGGTNEAPLTLSPSQTPEPLDPDDATAPSETWPTLTVPPTLTPEPTRPRPSGPTRTPRPSPTRPPINLAPTPAGSPPPDLQSLYYVADNNGTPELHVLRMDSQGKRWQDSNVVTNLPLTGYLIDLFPSPDGKYIAAEVARGIGSVYVIERSSEQAWCPLAEPAKCTGGIWDWTLDNQLVFLPFDVQPPDVVSGGGLVVDIATGRYSQLDLPAMPDKGYSLAQNISLNPDNSRLAYSITYPENKEEVSEIWTMHMDGSDKQLVRKVKGLINTLAWSPVGEQLVYVYQSNPGQFMPSELRLVNADGSSERLLATDLPMPGERRYRPAWSPDGHHVAFVQLDNPPIFHTILALASGNIYVVDTLTGQTTKLSSFEERDITYPTWAPNGNFVAFVSTIITDKDSLYSEVWVASADGRQLYAISETAKWYNALAWLPASLQP